MSVLYEQTKRIKTRKKLSQKEIAKEMSISEKTLSRWEYEGNPLERLESLVDELKEHKDLLGVLD